MNYHLLFDSHRFKQLLSNELRINQKPILIAAATIVVFWTLLSFGESISESLYIFMLYFGGFILTSRCFKELHNTELTYHYLTLPCSNLERFLSKWLITSVGYAIALLILFYLFNMLRLALDIALTQHMIETIQFFDSNVWQHIGIYIVLHSMVFLGAVIFKRYSLLKTSLFFGCLFLVLFYIIGAIGMRFFPYDDPSALQNLVHFVKLNHFLFWVALAPLCWIVTYLRITECEIS